MQFFSGLNIQSSPELHSNQFKDDSLIINASILDTSGSMENLGNFFSWINEK